MTRLRTTMIFVMDLPRMAAFYSDVLGLTPIAETRTDHWAEFDAGGAGIALHAIPAHFAATLEAPVEPREDYPVKLIFEAPDPAAEWARLAARGVAIIERLLAGPELQFAG